MTLEMFLEKLEVHHPYRIFLGPEVELIDIQYPSLKRFLHCNVKEFHAEKSVIFIMIDSEYTGRDTMLNDYYGYK